MNIDIVRACELADELEADVSGADIFMEAGTEDEARKVSEARETCDKVIAFLRGLSSSDQDTPVRKND